MNLEGKKLGRNALGVFRQNLNSGEVHLTGLFSDVLTNEFIHDVCHYEELINEIVHPEDQKSFLKLVYKSETKSIDSRGEFRIDVKHNYRWFDCLISIVESDNSNKKILEIVIVDIHERKLQRDHLITQNKALEVAAESVHIGIWDWNMIDNDLQWNSRMFELFDIDPETFQNSYQDFAGRVHKEDLPFVEKEIQSAIAGEKDYEAEYRVIHRNGDELLIAADGVILKNKKGENQRMIGVCVNISDKREFEKFQSEKHRLLTNENEVLNEMVNERTLELNHAIQELESFAYSVSHDLSGPLRAISGFTEILKEEYEDKNDAEFRRLLNIIDQNSKKLRNQIATILDYNRLNSIKVIPGDVHLAEVIADEVNELGINHSYENVDFQISELPVIKADLALFKMMVKQLLSNALKFSSTIDKRVIQIKYSLQENEHILTISDNGVGFDMNYYDKLFTIFQRLHSDKEFEGTGIGLAIVKKIVEKHKGMIYAKSEPYSLTSFTVHLPVGE